MKRRFWKEEKLKSTVTGKEISLLIVIRYLLSQKYFLVLRPFY
jgi:hypothetical protein